LPCLGPRDTEGCSRAQGQTRRTYHTRGPAPAPGTGIQKTGPKTLNARAPGLCRRRRDHRPPVPPLPYDWHETYLPSVDGHHPREERRYLAG
jgi:hypothetical protein